MTDTARIALIDDSKADTKLIQKAFEEIDFDCTFQIFHDAEEAYYSMDLDNRQNSAIKYDLILLDISMPKVSGLELLSYLKTHPFYQNVPAIMLTSSNDLLNMEKSLEFHADSYLVKPDSYQELLSLARSIRDFWFNNIDAKVE